MKLVMTAILLSTVFTFTPFVETTTETAQSGLILGKNEHSDPIVPPNASA